MDQGQWEAFCDCAVQELREKQKRLSNDHGIGGFARWWFDQGTASLQFFDGKGRLGLEASIIDIGSYSPPSGTWKWAWCNDSVLPVLQKAASPLRELCAITGMPIFHQERPFKIDEPGAWELAAIAVRHLGAIGCYRAPSSGDGPTCFLAIMSIRSVN